MRRRGRWRRWGKWVTLLAAAVVVPAWAWSGWYSAGVIHTTGSGYRDLWLHQGCVMYRQGDGDGRFGLPEGFDGQLWREAGGPKWDMGFTVAWPDPRNPWHRTIMIPLWAPLLILLGASASLWWWDGRLVRAAARGLCVRCGYDLSGIEGPVCPECGTAAAA